MKALTYIVVTQLCLAGLMIPASFVSSYIAAQRSAHEHSDTAARYLSSTETCLLVSVCIVLFSIVELWLITKGPAMKDGLAYRMSNHPASGKAGIAPPFPIERLCPGLPEPGR